MDTINISVTTTQTKTINNLMRRYGYANRSEFFRSLIRTLTARPEIITTADDDIVFESPNTKNYKEIVRDFKKTGKYNKAFLKDLEDGLKDSDYFK